MFAAGIDRGRTLGNLLALGVPTAFALNIIVLRQHARAGRHGAGGDDRRADVDRRRAAAARCRSTASLGDLAVLAPMGMLQLGLGCLLMTRATRYLPAGELGLLSLLETILAPLWVWLGVGERPSSLALVGALVVFGALVVNEWIGMRRMKAARAPAVGAPVH